ncbi:hypothetical protein BvCms12BK_02603 [Escherichia coli]|nr:hypothetical protein BvCms12BK_02603 [Escherichia coli]
MIFFSGFPFILPPVDTPTDKFFSSDMPATGATKRHPPEIVFCSSSRRQDSFVHLACDGVCTAIATHLL